MTFIDLCLSSSDPKAVSLLSPEGKPGPEGAQKAPEKSAVKQAEPTGPIGRPEGGDEHRPRLRLAGISEAASRWRTCRLQMLRWILQSVRKSRTRKNVSPSARKLKLGAAAFIPQRTAVPDVPKSPPRPGFRGSPGPLGLWGGIVT